MEENLRRRTETGTPSDGKENRGRALCPSSTEVGRGGRKEGDSEILLPGKENRI